MAGVRQKYDEEFKASAVRLSYESNKSVPEVAEDLGISDGILYQWRQNTVDEEKSTGVSPKDEDKALQLENAELRMHRDAETKDGRKAEPAVLRVQTSESDELTLADVWNALKRGRVKLLAWLLICVLIGGIGGAGYVLLSAEDQVVAVFQYSHDGIENGLDPRGAALDVTKIKGSHIVQPVLSQLGYEVGDEKVNAETVRQAITIEGQLPKDVIDRLTVVNTIAANPNSVTHLEKVLDISYYPTQYKISLNAGELGISTEAARELLDGILESYSEYFYRTYSDVQMMGRAINGLDYESYDYTEALDVLGAQIDTITDYVNELRAQAGGFRSAETGYTFADINATLDVIRTTDLSSLSAQVYTHSLTKDKALLTNHLNHQLEEKNQQLQVAQQVLAAVNDKLDTCQKDTITVMDNSDADVTWTRPSNEYGKLIEQSIEVSGQVAQLQAQIDKLQNQVENAQSINARATSGEYESQRKEAEGRLQGVAQKLQNWADVIDQTAEEYFLTAGLGGAFKVRAFSQDVSQGRLVKMLRYSLIGAAGGLGIVLLLYVIGVCFNLATSDKRREYSRSAPGVSA